MASNIVRFDGEGGIEILIDTATGESFASIRGYARMSEKGQSTIQSRVDRLSEGERKILTKTAEIETPGGMQGVRLLTEYLICDWLPDDNPAAAKTLLRLGVRVGMHKLAGYEVTSSAIASPTDAKTYTIDMVLRRDPMDWERMFKADWISEAERLTGWKWRWKAMSNFIIATVYDYLPFDVVMTLREMNPPNASGNRIYKHHQFLQPEVRSIVVDHLNEVETLMKAARGNLSLFEMLMANRFGRYKLVDHSIGQSILFDVEYVARLG